MKTIYTLGIVVLLAFSASTMAGNAGVKVSAPAVDCGDKTKETNVLESGAPARIWIHLPAGTNTNGLTYTITDQGKPVVNPTTFTVTACGDGYFFGDITLPAGQGSITLSVEDKDGANVGSDSFQLS